MAAMVLELLVDTSWSSNSEEDLKLSSVCCQHRFRWQWNEWVIGNSLIASFFRSPLNIQSRQTEIFEHPLGFWYMVRLCNLRRHFLIGVNRKMRTSCKVTTYGIFYLVTLDPLDRVHIFIVASNKKVFDYVDFQKPGPGGVTKIPSV